jgi:hypothetical protein
MRGVLLVGLIVVGALRAACADGQEVALKTFSIKSGESVDLGPTYWIRLSDCLSLLTAFAGVDVLEGPPDVTLSIREQEVYPRQQSCQNNKTPGGVVVATATTVQSKRSAVLKYRVRYNTREGLTQSTHSVQLDLYP